MMRGALSVVQVAREVLTVGALRHIYAGDGDGRQVLLLAFPLFRSC